MPKKNLCLAGLLLLYVRSARPPEPLAGAVQAALPQVLLHQLHGVPLLSHPAQHSAVRAVIQHAVYSSNALVREDTMDVRSCLVGAKPDHASVKVLPVHLPQIAPPCTRLVAKANPALQKPTQIRPVPQSDAFFLNTCLDGFLKICDSPRLYRTRSGCDGHDATRSKLRAACLVGPPPKSQDKASFIGNRCPGHKIQA